jgi:hypothetical protein
MQKHPFFITWMSKSWFKQLKPQGWLIEATTQKLIIFNFLQKYDKQDQWNLTNTIHDKLNFVGET